MGGQDQVDPKWPSHLPLTTSMGSMGGVYQGHRVYPTTLIYISQRLVPDSGVRLQCMKLAGGREIIQSGPHTALECMRPSEIKSTLLSASHNPQGGDNLDCPMMYMWSLPFLPKPCVCEVRAGGTEWGIAWSARDLMRKPRIPPTPLLSQYSERSSCLVGGRRNNCNSHRSLVL